MRGESKKNVALIADDDLFVRKVLKVALDGLCEIVEVTDGADVLATYQATMPDILFLDIHLPNQSGLNIIKAICAHDKDAHIIMLSADSSAENVKIAVSRGAKGFLTKPFEKKRAVEIFNLCPTVKYAD